MVRGVLGLFSLLWEAGDGAGNEVAIIIIARQKNLFVGRFARTILVSRSCSEILAGQLPLLVGSYY